MKTSILIFLTLLIAPMSGAKEEYQDGKYLGYTFSTDGYNCSVGGSVDANGNFSGTEKCADHAIIEYKIQTTEFVFSVKKTLNHPGRAVMTMGYSAMFDTGTGVLNPGIYAGTPIQVRFTKNFDAVFVKIGKKESRYAIIPGSASKR